MWLHCPKSDYNHKPKTKCSNLNWAFPVQPTANSVHAFPVHFTYNPNRTFLVQPTANPKWAFLYIVQLTANNWLNIPETVSWWLTNIVHLRNSFIKQLFQNGFIELNTQVRSPGTLKSCIKYEILYRIFLSCGPLTALSTNSYPHHKIFFKCPKLQLSLSELC